ncbi:MAG: AraC family transcriptional regulator [Eubacteriales bacterium]|nr:AraC family transcriptional regulator [Eubacteriales bacterium]
MKLDTIVVESLHVIKTKSLPRNFDVAPRNHHSLSYRIKGDNTLYFENTEITSNAHTLTFVPMGKSYNHHIITPSEQIVAHFTAKENNDDRIENFTLPLHHDMEYLFYSLYNQWELGQKENDLQCMSIFYNILALIAKTIVTSDNSKSKLLYDSVAYMHAHYREIDFNITKLYEQTYITPAYYRRLFNEVYKCSPIKYLKNLRLNYAKQLLRSGYYTITEVAELSGFSASTYFSYEFKKMTGYTPSEYQSSGRHNTR